MPPLPQRHYPLLFLTQRVKGTAAAAAAAAAVPPWPLGKQLVAVAAAELMLLLVGASARAPKLVLMHLLSPSSLAELQRRCVLRARAAGTKMQEILIAPTG